MKKTWYEKGLFFKCKNCGKCCYGFPGYVWISEKDIENISKFLKISKFLFLQKYTRKIGEKISLKELKGPNFECIFLKDKKCQIYSVRPYQCKSYPFWRENLKSKKHFEEYVLKNCKGAHDKSFKYSFEEIEKFFNETIPLIKK